MLSHRLIRTAAAFFVVGVLLGLYMGANQDFRFTHVHAHLNLLGWVALGLIGLIYHQHPQLQHGWLAHGHYWLHTLGLLVFMGSLAWSVAGGTEHGIGVATGATMVGLAVLLFGMNVGLRLQTPLSRAAG